MDVRYINPFLAAISDVFETMINVPIKIGKPCVNGNGSPMFEVSGIIGMSGTVSGSIVISMSDETALELASGLLGEELKTIDSDVTDAIGEVTNMIVGNAKSNFPDEGVTISVPTVVVGKHKVSYPSGIPIISIPCDANDKKMVVDVAIKKI